MANACPKADSITGQDMLCLSGQKSQALFWKFLFMARYFGF
jgi:hypothetical protein